MKNKTISVCEVFDCDVHDALLFLSYIFNRRETWSSFILNCCKQIWGMDRAALLKGRPRAVLSLATPLPRYSLSHLAVISVASFMMTKYRSSRSKHSKPWAGLGIFAQLLLSFICLAMPACCVTATGNLDSWNSLTMFQKIMQTCCTKLNKQNKKNGRQSFQLFVFSQLQNNVYEWNQRPPAKVRI